MTIPTRAVRAPLLVACAAVLNACAAKGAVLNRIQAGVDALPSPALCGTVIGVSIRDDRPSVSERPLEVPAFSGPGQRDQVRPPLTDEIRALIQDEVRRRVGPGGGGDVAVEVRIIEGQQRFRASWHGERETARWRVEVRLRGAEGSAAGRGEGDFDARSIDASAAFTERLYRESLRYVLAQALDQAAGRLPGGARGCGAGTG